jgi:hypothetical protein
MQATTPTIDPSILFHLLLTFVQANQDNQKLVSRFIDTLQALASKLAGKKIFTLNIILILFLRIKKIKN